VDSFKTFLELEEGVNDPAIFKAVFLAGGPGSGKSFIVGKTALQALGLKLINSDTAFEAALKKADLKPNPEDISSPEGQMARAKAKTLTAKQMGFALKGRLGLIIDGTGKDFEKIKAQTEKLQKLGYEVQMIFVNTDIETALQRNRNRTRSLDDDLVKKMWSGVQNNIGKFQSLFRGNIIIIDNSDGSDFEPETLSAYKKVMKWTKTKPKSPAANLWIDAQNIKKG